MFCVNCGNEIEEGLQSCPFCNEKIEDETITSEDIKDFAIEYSAIMKEKSVELMDAAKEKIEKKKKENAIERAERAETIAKQQEQAQVMMKQQEQEPVMMNQQDAIQTQQKSSRLRCPKCQNENLQIIQETSTKGRDMSAGKGCCGYILLGPFGLLCGMCGKGKQMKTTTYWMCPVCGNKFKA